MPRQVWAVGMVGALIGLVSADGSFNGAQGPNGLGEQIRGYLDRAVPLLSEVDDKNKHAFLLVPASDIGRHLGEEWNAPEALGPKITALVMFGLLAAVLFWVGTRRAPAADGEPAGDTHVRQSA